MNSLKIAAACLLTLLLSGCFHVQLNGSIADSQVTIAPLRQPNSIVASGVSASPGNWIQTLGKEQWEEQLGPAQLLLVGIATPETETIDPQVLYLVTASGGADYDSDSTGTLSDNPQSVQGSWHAIVPGQRILDGNVKVSVLTEALYLQVLDNLDQLSNTEVLARLDAAAQLTVTDVDRNDTVDYADVISWNRMLDASAYRGEISAINALADAITAGQPLASRIEFAKALLGSETVVMTFDIGDVVVATDNWESPITVANFLGYVEDGFYDQMLIHRTINNFMIQAGLLDYLGLEDGLIQYAPKTAGSPIVNESSNGLSNVRGTIAMARTSDPDSAAAQWFINQANNTFLDYGSSENPDGYAVFAAVVSGMDIVDQIAAEPTVRISNIGNNVPARGVILEKVRITE
jgi:cyclophilin family peptidyl-prolyl cis-trans isomerase